MKRNIFKGAGSLIICLCFVLGLMAGCGNKKEPVQVENTTTQASGTEEGATPAPTEKEKPDTSKELKLKMWLVGDAQPDADMVFDEVNKEVKELINATVQVHYTTWTDYMSKYQLIFSSGEDFDLASCFDFSDYNGLATKGAFREITMEMLEMYCPDIVRDWPDVMFEDPKVNGKLYQVPNNTFAGSWPFVVAIRGDLREKYGMSELKSLQDYEAYLLKVAESEKGIIALNADAAGLPRPLFFDQVYQVKPLSFSGNMLFREMFVTGLEDTSGTVSKVIEMPEYKDYLDKMRSLYQADVFPKNVLSNKVASGGNYTSGTSASTFNNIDDVYGKITAMATEHPEWKGEIANIQPESRTVLPNKVSGMVLPVHGKNPERALMLINLLMTNHKIYDLTNFGIEGKHFEAVGDDLMTPLPDASNFVRFANVPWGWTNDLLLRSDTTEPQWMIDAKQHWRDAAVNNPVHKVTLDDSNIKNEIAAVNNVVNTYIVPMEAGVLDYEENYEKIVAKLYEAGLDKIYDDITAQINAGLSK